jgi:hypothetical protein
MRHRGILFSAKQSRQIFQPSKQSEARADNAAYPRAKSFYFLYIIKSNML